MHLKAFLIVGVGSLAMMESASALPVANLDGAVTAPIEKTQFYGGPRCFYPDGWHGPGYYRCGFRFRRGLGFLGVGGGRGFAGRGGFVGHGGRGGFVGHGGRGGHR